MMRRTITGALEAAVAILVVLLPSFATARAITVLGSSDAHDCFLNASMSVAVASSLDSCRKALEAGNLSTKDHAATWVNMGIVLNSLGRTDDAIEAFEEALARSPNLPEAALSRGNSHFLRKDFDQAAADYELSIEWGLSDEAAARFNHGLAHAKMGSFEQAAISYRRALELRPDFERARAQLDRLRALGLAEGGAPRLRPVAGP